MLGEIIIRMIQQPQFLDFENQYLFFIGRYSPFLRSSSGKKSRGISYYHLPEATSFGKDYLTRCYFSSGLIARLFVRMSRATD
jgi:hypothetical protein